VVVDSTMILLPVLREFMREPLRKPSLETHIQEKAVFEPLSVSYDPNTHSATLQSLACDKILRNLRSKVCLCIVNVIPNIESKETQAGEMCVAKGPTHDHRL
jgi:hypothetical protein